MNKIIEKFQTDYPTKAAKEKALKSMTNEQIDELIKASGNVQAKIFYSSFKKTEPDISEKRFNDVHDPFWSSAISTGNQTACLSLRP